LRLVEDAANRQRALDMLENAMAARAGQATEDSFKRFVNDLKKRLK
jgi:hypothetical protein